MMQLTALNYMGCKDIAYTDNCPNPSVLPNRTQQLSQEKINDNRISYECIGDQLWKMQLQGRLRWKSNSKLRDSSVVKCSTIYVVGAWQCWWILRIILAFPLDNFLRKFTYNVFRKKSLLLISFIRIFLVKNLCHWFPS